MGQVLAALQIDEWRPDLSFAEVKKAFTPAVVKRIYELIPSIWPDFNDYQDCHLREKSTISALYTGSYELNDIFKTLTRHSTYSERIFLVDPFLDPRLINERLNPVLHPEENRPSAIKFTFIWLSLLPWIEAGIVNFVRSPIDFLPGLWNDIVKLQDDRIKHFPEIVSLVDHHSKEKILNMGPLDGGLGEYFLLSQPDEFFLKQFENFPGENPFGSSQNFVKFIKQRRDAHPYYVDKLEGQQREFIQETSGACYELSKLICSYTGSHLITNLRSRWREIELDRSEAKIDMMGWSPFAKALQNAELQVLDKVSLEAALTLRKENRLEKLRLFFRKIWKESREAEEFSDVNALNLAIELNERISEAKSEWEKIDQDLMKWFGMSGATMVSAGLVGFVPAGLAAAVTGFSGLVDSHLKRKNFRERFPAGFFLDIAKRN